jgi:pimeloyl-ACP methyl ester carboxylesterase
MESINLEYPARDYGGIGESLHFLHANGYPPACYLPLINRLISKYHVFGMLMRPLWEGSKPEELSDWQPLSDDLNKYLIGRNKGKVVAVGHSLGAVVSLRSAIQFQDNFRALILIDPVLFSPLIMKGWNYVKQLGLGYKLHPLIPVAKGRRRFFDDLNILFKAYRRKKIFRYISDDNLKILINGMVRSNNRSGYELAYSPEWEIKIYYTGVSSDADIWRSLPDLKLPILIIRGQETDTFYPSTADRMRKIRPVTQVVTVKKSTHLVPFEKPDEVSGIIFDFLEKVI